MSIHARPALAAAQCASRCSSARALKSQAADAAVLIISEFMPRERAVCAIKHVGRKKQVVAHGGRPGSSRCTVDSGIEATTQLEKS